MQPLELSNTTSTSGEGEEVYIARDNTFMPECVVIGFTGVAQLRSLVYSYVSRRCIAELDIGNDP